MAVLARRWFLGPTASGVIDEHQVELAAVDVDVGDPHLDPVAQPVAPARAAADQRVRLRPPGSSNRRPGW